VIDTYVKTESERLLYLRVSHTKLGVDEHIYLEKAVVDDEKAKIRGK
jgi:hypothetical protein